ncbi:MAG: alpha/beta hydrolase [Aggregatilineales bacterium]
MKKQLLFIHSAGSQDNGEGSTQLLDVMKAELSDDYDIIAPLMPDPENPDSAAWQTAVKTEINALNTPYILIGHSLGASTILKTLTESTVSKLPEALFLISTPFWSNEGWEVAEYALNDDFAKRLPSLKANFLYHSRDDEIVPFSHLLSYEEKIPQATLRKLDGYGHFLELDSFPQLIADIQALN